MAAVEAEMQINSPSKVFAGIGEFMAMGLGEGFAAEMRNVESTIRRETANAVPERDTGEGRRTDPSARLYRSIFREFSCHNLPRDLPELPRRFSLLLRVARFARIDILYHLDGRCAGI